MFRHGKWCCFLQCDSVSSNWCFVQQAALLQRWCHGRLKASWGRRSSAASDGTVWTSSLQLGKVRPPQNTLMTEVIKEMICTFHIINVTEPNRTSSFCPAIGPDCRTQGTSGDTPFGRANGKTGGQFEVLTEVGLNDAAGSGLTVMLCFHSDQSGDAVQRRRGSAGRRSGQSGHLLPSQRRSVFLHSDYLCWLREHC